MYPCRNTAGLVFRDCILLQSQFEEQAARLFPFPARARLYASFREEVTPEYDQWPSFLKKLHQASLHDPNQGNNNIGLFEGSVCCPLQLFDGGLAFLVLDGVDHALLKKFSQDWFCLFQEQIHHLFTALQRGFRHPETGLFNRCALLAGIRNICPDGQKCTEKILYLIHLSFVRRSISGTFNRIQYFADLLNTIENHGLFYLGQGVYALLLNVAGHKEQRLLAHRLQKFLRREKLQRVHIAFGEYASFFHPDNSGKGAVPDPFGKIFAALSLAERRGPFGICDARVLEGQAMHPFVMPPRAVVRKMQRLWRGLDRFCLSLFSVQNISDTGEWLTRACRELLAIHAETMHCVPVSAQEIFVLFPGAGIAEAERRINSLQRELMKKINAPVSVGYCNYPDLDHCKIETIRRCYKALMHGAFYGRDAVVRFDHVSLNVSGDWYFDQGDFRQAVREYAQGLKRAPGEKNLLNSLGVALIEMKQTARAMAAFEEVLQQDPDNDMALVNLGYACLQKGLREKALEYFEKAHTVQYHAGIERPDVLRQLSRLYVYFGRFADALRLVKRWQECADVEQDFMYYRILGRAYLETGSPGPAIRALQTALRIHPRDAESMSLLGLLYIQEGEGVESGEILLKKALSLDDRDPACWLRLARAFALLARYDEALVAVRNSLALRKGSVDARLLQVEILIGLEKRQQARQILARLIRQDALSAVQKRKAEELFSEFFDKSQKET